MTNQKKEIIEQAKKEGLKVAIVGSGMSGKRVLDAMMQADNNMKKTGIEKL